ncbi:AAA family ATPase [Sphingopyxis chilensis]
MGETASLLEWAAKQPDWTQDALRRHAKAPGFHLDEQEKAAVIARVRHAAGIAQDEDRSCVPLSAEHLALGHAAGPRTLLCSFGPVSNVGRLAKDQQLRFALDGLTLIYGDNGTGKSGYCRIAKKVCRSSTTEDILGNIFDEGDKAPAEVLIRYCAEPEPDDKGEIPVVEHRWQDGSLPPDAVRSISVFDSRNARLYVDKENRIGFLPGEISLLERHGKLRSEMDLIFQREKSDLESELAVALPGGFTEGGAIASLIEPLQFRKALPEAAAILAAGEWTTQLQAELDTLEKAYADDPAALASKCRRAAAALETYLPEIAAIQSALSDEVEADLKAKFDARREAFATAQVAAADAFADLPLKGVGGGAWEAMYRHAVAYIQSIDLGETLPSALGDPCALCQQPLDDGASRRLQDFQNYLTGAAASAHAAAETALRGAVALLDVGAIPTQISVELALAEYREMNADRSTLGARIGEFIGSAICRRDDLRAAADHGVFDQVAKLLVIPDVQLDVAALNAEADHYLEQVAAEPGPDVQLSRLNDLKDQKKLHDALATFLARHDALERHSKILICLKLVGRQQLSTLITNIRRRLVTEGLQDRIKEEIAGLDLEYLPFSVSDRSSDGSSFFEVHLAAPVTAPNERILSEGEQRALALACFLAEVGADTQNHGLIIDDPVSSLDHSRIRRVAERLTAEAAKGKQVIIFTHNLLFYNEVLHAAAALVPQVKVARRLISKSAADGFGIVSEEDEPWTTRKVTKRIAELQVRVKEMDSLSDYDTEIYRRQAKDFYTDLRETWERLVEELLLGKVVERYSADVRTQSLKNVIVEDSDYTTVFFAMKRVSERSGHDTPAGKQIGTPSPGDMKSDLDVIDAYRASVDKRRKKVAEEREALEKPPAARTV